MGKEEGCHECGSSPDSHMKVLHYHSNLSTLQNYHSCRRNWLTRSVCRSVPLFLPQPAGRVWHNQGTWSCISYRHMAQSISHKTRLFHLRLQITIIKWNNLGKLYIFWIHRVMSVFQLLWFVSVICLDATGLNKYIVSWRKWWENVCYLKFEELTFFIIIHIHKSSWLKA